MQKVQEALQEELLDISIEEIEAKLCDLGELFNQVEYISPSGTVVMTERLG